MFLMKTFPLVALQQNWEPFGQAKSCRYPACFSESEGDLARTAVSAKVQMILTDLQSEEVSLGPSLEYGCLVQEKQRGGRGRRHKSRRRGQVPQGGVKHTLHNCPEDSDGMEVEEPEPLSLNSDSDDSVDRDIEEAIQEHLRNKAQDTRSLPSNPKNLPVKEEVQSIQQEHPPCGAGCRLFPSGCSPANLVPQNVASDCTGTRLTRWASSPRSEGCKVPFEQELEQFLNKKKPQARNKITRRNKQCYPREFQETLAGCQKGGAKRASHTPLKQGSLFKVGPNLQVIAVPRRLKSEPTEELAGSNTGSQVDFTAPAIRGASFPKQSEGGGNRQVLCKGGGEPGLALSDSSSDDGIEEAIRLYQLEKSKQAAILRAGRASGPKGEGGSLGQTARLGDSPFPEITQKTLKSKRDEVSAKPLGSVWTDLGKAGVPRPPEEGLSKGTLTCRTDSAAELMCAEAILDISKTILPSSMAGCHGPFPSHPVFSSQTPVPPEDEGEPDTVDSDDSIEQEIRAFLAVRAKAEPSVAKSSRNLSRPGQGPSWRESKEPTRSCKQTTPKRLNVKQKSRAVAQLQDTQMILEYVDRPLAKASRAQLASPESVPDAKDAGDPLGFASPHGLCGSGSLVKNRTGEQQKCESDEKSSSFDSDEDLDTAIKDLLRSKRKLKKRSKDQRVHCKKKVKFGDTEMPGFDHLERDSKSPTSTLLEKCLVSSRRKIKEGIVKKGPLSLVKGKPKGAKPEELESESEKEHQAKLVSLAELQEAAQTPLGLCAVASSGDGGSSIDSDDGIELEIQRFLAEKAKGGQTAGAFRGAGGVAEALGADKGQAAPSKAERQLPQCGGSTLQSASKETTLLGLSVPEWRSERETEGNASPHSDHAETFGEGRCSPTPVKSQAHPRTVRGRLVGLRGRQAAGQKKAVYGKRFDQRMLSPGTAKAECYKWQTSFKPWTLFQRKGAYEFKTASQLLAGLRGGRKKAVLLGRRQSIGPASLKKQGVLSAADSFGDVSLPNEAVRSRREAEQPSGLNAGSLHPSLQEWRANTQDEVVNLAKNNPMKGPESCQHVDFSQRLHFHELSPDEPRVVTVSAGITQIESSVREKGERQISTTPWEKWKVPSSPCNLPPDRENVTQPREESRGTI